MRQSQWEKVTFGSTRVDGHIENSMIMPRECIVGKNQFNATAFQSIREWVQEQAITMGDTYIDRIAQKLLKMWQSIPKDCNYIVFTLVSTTGDVFYCLVQTENVKEEIWLKNQRSHRIKECKVVKNSDMTRSVAWTQIRAWVNALGFFYNANGVKTISENLLQAWERLPNDHYIVFKFVVPTRNFLPCQRRI